MSGPLPGQSLRRLVRSPMALGCALALGGLQAIGLAGSQDPGPTPSQSAVLYVDARRAFQVMEGFGTSERVFDDPHVTNTWDPTTQRSAVRLTAADEDAILDRLYVELGLTRVRPTTEGGVEVENDNRDPDRTDLSRFNFAWKRNDAHVDYVHRARQRGLTTFFLSPIRTESWMRADDVDEYCEWALTIVRRWRALGLEMPFYSVGNEPDRQPNGRMSAEFMRDVIKKLGRQFRDDGFETKFVITDAIGPREAYVDSSIILSDPEARRYVGALATHLYNGKDLRQLAALSAEYRIPLWMTEFSRERGAVEYAGLMSDLMTLYNVSAIDYMWGFFGEWDRAQLLRLMHNNPRSQNYNPAEGPVYLGYAPEKVYFMVGQFSRFVRPGDRRVETVSYDHNVKLSAFRSESGLAVVVVNQGAELRARFEVQGFPAQPWADAIRTTEEKEDWRTLEAIPVTPSSSFTADLPAASVTTFSLHSADRGDNAVP